jgi:hypothetical protein
MKGLRAKDESRTRDLNLGKVALYQLSYFRLYFQFFLVSNSDQNPPAGGLRSTPDSYREATFAYIFNFFWSRTPTKIRPLADCALLPIAIGKLLSLIFSIFLVSNSDQNPPAGGLRSTPDSYREATFAYIFNFSGLELRPKSARWRIALYSR